MNNLKYRRQFLFSAKKCLQLENWKREKLGKYYLYVHPDCELTRINKTVTNLIMIGYAIDPKFPDKSNLDILEDIIRFTTINEVPQKIYSLAGRFVLIIKIEDHYTFFHDACGLKLLFYTKYKEDIYAASQPLLLKLVINLSPGLKHHKYYESQYVKSTIEHWIPSGISLYDDVYQLVPNHYLDVSKFKQIRFWPNKPIKKESLDDAVEKFSVLLKNTMLAANRRYKLALSLTAGWDSRTILSACKNIANDIVFYTLQYRDLTEMSSDIKIPHKLLLSLGYKHQIIDTREPIDDQFSNFYKENTDIPHINDWGIIANGMYSEYPSERIAIRGNCAEIGRCFYYSNGIHPHISSSDDILILEYNWKHIDFIKNQVSKWFEEISNPKVNFGYNLLDLFYWEHRMGSWQAQSQLEWDIVQEPFTPFNNRELIDTMLNVESKYRCKPNYLFFKNTIKLLWNDTLTVPINPKSIQKKIKVALKSILIQIRIYDKIKSYIKK